MGLTRSASPAPTRVVELRDGEIDALHASRPETAGSSARPRTRSRAGAPDENAERRAPCWAARPGIERELTLLNAGAAIYVGGRAESIEAGVAARGEAIDSGAAPSALERYVAETQELARREPPPRRARRGHARAARAAQARAPAGRARARARRGDGEGRPFAEALSRPGTSLIAEHKRRSPSAGAIREGATCAEIVRAYERGGAAALSILTEEATSAARSTTCARRARRPTCRSCARTSRVDPYQLYEAKAAGADACCWWSARSQRDELSELQPRRRELDLDAIVEVHDEEELERALEIDADVIGINNRDLEDFTVDIQRTFDLLTDVPAGKTVVSESGIRPAPRSRSSSASASTRC